MVINQVICSQMVIHIRGTCFIIFKVIRLLLTAFKLRVERFILRKLGFGDYRPWMILRELLVMIDVLKHENPGICLEWGSGGSTTFFTRYLADSVWTSIEHDHEWARRVAKRVSTFPKITVHHIQPNRFPWSDEHRDGTYDDLRAYVDFPKQLDRKFDLIFIDGRARVACLKVAQSLLKEDGTVILHDAGRDYYRQGFKFFSKSVLLLDFRPEGGIWVGCIKKNPRTVFDVEAHRVFWIMAWAARRFDRILHKVVHKLYNALFGTL